MVKVANLSLSRLNAAELFRQQEQFGITIESVGAEKLKIPKQYVNWKQDFQNFDLSIKIMRKSLVTEKIAECDKECDKAYAGMFDIAKTTVSHFEPAMVASAKNVVAVFKNYGKISRLSMNEKVSLIQNIAQDFRGKFNTDIKKIGLEGWLEHLESLGRKMVGLMTERFDESAEKSTISLRVARKAIETDYKDICSIINALVLMDGPENYEEFILKLNAVNAKFGGKRTRSNNDELNANEENGNGESEDKYPNAREWNEDIDYQTCASGDIFYIVRNGKKEYYKLLDYGEVTTFEPGMDDGGIWERLS